MYFEKIPSYQTDTNFITTIKKMRKNQFWSFILIICTALLAVQTHSNTNPANQQISQLIAKSCCDLSQELKQSFFSIKKSVVKPQDKSFTDYHFYFTSAKNSLIALILNRYQARLTEYQSAQETALIVQALVFLSNKPKNVIERNYYQILRHGYQTSFPS